MNAAVRAAVARAQLLHAQLRLEGRIGETAPAAATAWFRTAARQGDPHAINMLGRACELGWGMKPDPKAAAKHYERAAALGDPWAMFNLADLLLNGRGVPADERRAYALYAEAGALGHAKALNMLGVLREAGRGAARDDALALDLFRAAAEGGDCWGAFNLARRLADEGETEQALFWIERAIDAGFPDFWRAAASLLEPHPDARMRALGRAALERAATSSDTRPEIPDMTSLDAPKPARRGGLVTTVLNRYATPLTTGLFLISTISGVALFFRWQPRAFHAMHEWLSLLLLVPVIFHLWKNWRPLTNYARRGWLVVPLVLSVVAAAPFAWSGLTSTGGGNPSVRVIRVIAKAPLADLAPVLRMTPDALVADLRAKGYAVSSADQTLEAVAAAAGVPAPQLLVGLTSRPSDR